MRLLKLITHDVQDQVAQENFVRLQDFLTATPGLHNFRHMSVTIPQAAVNYKIPHKLGFIPLDIVQTSLTGAGALTWNYAEFDREFLDVTITGACVVRFFVGSHKEGV